MAGKRHQSAREAVTGESKPGGGEGRIMPKDMAEVDQGIRTELQVAA